MGSTKSRRIVLTLVIDWVELDFFFQPDQDGLNLKKKNSTRTILALMSQLFRFR